jgi:hypothetical protein
MRTRERSLIARQALLQSRSGLLRGRLVLQGRAMTPTLAWADQGWAAAQWLRAHPAWPAAALVALVLVRPRRILGWAGRAVWAWQLWRRVQPLLQRAGWLPQRR